MSGIDGLTQRRARLTPEQQRLLQARLSGTSLAPSTGGTELTPSITRRTASPDSGVPLSHAQQRLWFLWQWDTASTAYHLSGALTLTGRLNEPALRACFDAWVQRHESLRTVFRVRADGLPEQIVQPARPMHIAVIDLRDSRAADRRAQADEQVRRIADTPFDLTRGPLLRATLLRLEDEVHLLAVAMHHIVSDAVSMKILIDELSAHYTARVQGLVPRLPELSIQYADYAAWQRASADQATLRRELAYWQGQLGREHPVLMLPTDHPRPSRPDHRAARHCFELPAQTVAGLRQRAQAESATLFMALLAGFQALLYRCSGQPDIRVGVPVANRHRPETEGVVGFFVNTQVLRVQIDPALTMGGLLHQTRDAAWAAQAHQELPFEQLVEALKPERGTDRMPLFQVVFNHLREDHGALAKLPGLTLGAHELGQHAALCDLALDTTEHPDGRVTAAFGYATALFDPSTIERMAGHYARLLQALADEPQVRV
ncbi:MAG: non-ribosomal peptide synthetase, partial [Rubrivivax sp.]